MICEMNSNKLQKIREKLNNMIEKGADANEILQVSMELDILIESYMELNDSKNRQ